VIVFTDGADNLSWMRPDGLVDEAKKAGIVIHVIELKTDQPQTRRPTSPALLEQGYLDGAPLLPSLTQQAGGRIWSAQSSSDLRRLFTEALDEMRARYLLTYTPRGVAREGWHTLKVSLQNARGDVTARPGYFVTPKTP
jgi:VWFA-related protein